VNASETNETTTSPQPGRRVVLEPTVPGFWLTVLGAVLAVLAPLFGFLVGTAMGPGDDPDALSPIQLGLFIGVVVGGCGAAIALLGVWRLFRSWREAQGS